MTVTVTHWQPEAGRGAGGPGRRRLTQPESSGPSRRARRHGAQDDRDAMPDSMIQVWTRNRPGPAGPQCPGWTRAGTEPGSPGRHHEGAGAQAPSRTGPWRESRSRVTVTAGGPLSRPTRNVTEGVRAPASPAGRRVGSIGGGRAPRPAAPEIIESDSESARVTVIERIAGFPSQVRSLAADHPPLSTGPAGPGRLPVRDPGGQTGGQIVHPCRPTPTRAGAPHGPHPT